MPDLENESALDLNSTLSRFFTESKNYTRLKKLKSKPYRLAYFALLPKGKRSLIDYKVDLEQQQQVAQDWNRFIDLYFSDKLPKYYLKAKKPLGTEKIIWQYWAQGVEEDQLPQVVQLCFDSIDKYHEDYTVIRLSDKNIHDYLDIPDFVWQKKAQNPAFKHAFFADLLRLALLDAYGGVWLDATVYLTAPLTDLSDEAGFFMYQRDPLQSHQEDWHYYNKYYFSWHKEHKVNVLNSIIFAKKNNVVIHTCLDLLLNFWHTQDAIPHYFFFQIIFDCLINNSFRAQQCPIVSDTKPHLLARHINQPFNEQDFQNIVRQSNLHKLSYNVVENNDTFFDYLIKNT